MEMSLEFETYQRCLVLLQVISANGELNAARALKEAAETIAQSSTAMQLRYLQTLNIIAAEKGSTIVFPIPIDMMGPTMMGPGVSSEAQDIQGNEG